ncbi:MAG: cupin domain-containing protein [Pseudomonadota bacterium]
MQTMIRLPATTGLEPSTGDLDGWTVIEGTPSMRTWVLHTSAAGDMACGIWECTPGTYHATYTAYEYVVMIEGRIVITPDGDQPVTVRAGDAFVVEPTFRGTWRIEEKVRKHFDFRLR